MKPIKVLHLIPTLSSGGAERQLVGLMLTSSRDRVSHIACVISDSSFLGPTLAENGFEVIELGLSTRRPFISGALAFRKIIELHRPSVIHSWLYDANIVARLALLPFNRLPLVTSWQLTDYDPATIAAAGWNPVKIAGLKILDQITSFVSKPHFVACSETVRRSFDRHFKCKGRGVRTIYNSVDLKALASAPDSNSRLRNELGLPNDAFVFLNVGRLDPQKNHQLILRAFSGVVGHAPNSYLLIVGVGGIEHQLRELTDELGLSDKVLFLGMRNDVGDLLGLADVFVFPSLMEGLPVALVEAMYKSLPCIASRLDVFYEVLNNREEGLLIDPSSPSELASAMIELYKDPDLRQTFGMRAYKKALAKFDATTNAAMWEALYIETVSNHPR